MPQLKNPRHERFAQELAKGSTAIAAYETAGYKPDDGASSRLSGKVRPRVQELLEHAADKATITIDSIAAQLDDDRSFAREVKQAGAAVSATMGKARVYGLLKDDRESGGLTINGNVNLARIERVIVHPQNTDR